MSDMISHPTHYTAGKVECIDAIESVLPFCKSPTEGFLLGQVLKYLWRYPLKGGVEDLRKAEWYMARLIAECQKAYES